MPNIIKLPALLRADLHLTDVPGFLTHIKYIRNVKKTLYKCIKFELCAIACYRAVY